MNTLHIPTAEMGHDCPWSNPLHAIGGADAADYGIPDDDTAPPGSLDVHCDVCWWEEGGVFLGVLLTDSCTGMRQQVTLGGHKPIC